MERSGNVLRSLIILATLTAVSLADDANCVYTFFIRTGSIIRGGTDSKISARLYDAAGEYVELEDLKSWGGQMGPDHRYFQRGELDIFSGRAGCVPSPICALNITSDGSGDHHGWYVNYVEVNVATVHEPCSSQKFKLEQWLGLDVAPFQLTALRSNCPDSVGSGTMPLLSSIV